MGDTVAPSTRWRVHASPATRLHPLPRAAPPVGGRSWLGAADASGCQGLPGWARAGRPPAATALRGVQSSQGLRLCERSPGELPCGEPCLGGLGERTALPEGPRAPLPARVRPPGTRWPWAGLVRVTQDGVRTLQCRPGCSRQAGGSGREVWVPPSPTPCMWCLGGCSVPADPRAQRRVMRARARCDAHTRGGPQEGRPREASQGDEGLLTAWGWRGLPPLLTPMPPHRSPTAAVPAPSSHPRSEGPGASPPARASQPTSPQTLSPAVRTGPPTAPGVGSSSQSSQEAKKGPAVSSGTVGAGAGSRLKPEAPLAKGKSPECGRGEGWAVGVVGSPGSPRPVSRSVPGLWSCFTARLLGARLGGGHLLSQPTRPAAPW